MEQLLKILREATKNLPELRYAWGLVGLSVTSAIAVYIHGNGKAALITGSVALIGFVILLLVIPKDKDADARTPRRFIVWSISIFFVTFLIMTITAFTITKPCNWASFLGIVKSSECSTHKIMDVKTRKSEEILDIADAICIHKVSYKPSNTIENNLNNIWIGTLKENVFKELGRPIFIYNLQEKETWFYKTENIYSALGFSNDGLLDELVIAIKDESESFKGYRFGNNNYYKDFVFGISAFKDFKIGLDKVEVELGPRGIIDAQIIPIKMARGIDPVETTLLSSFTTNEMGGIRFGTFVQPEYSMDENWNCSTFTVGRFKSVNAMMDCNEDQIAQILPTVLESKAGWLHIYMSNSVLNINNVLPKFSVLKKNNKNHGRYKDFC